MGSLGPAGGHSYAAQTMAFAISLLGPGSVFALLFGAWLENRKRNRARPPEKTEVPTASWQFSSRD
jgi:hypothetical protein